MPVGVAINEWSDEETAALQQHLADRKKLREIAELIGRPVSSISNKVARLTADPRRREARLAEKRERDAVYHVIAPYNHEYPESVLKGRPSVEALRERDLRLAAPLTPNCIILGDPPPGYSALDRRGA